MVPIHVRYTIVNRTWIGIIHVQWLVADWQTIARKREQHVHENLRRANQKRRQYDYTTGQQVLKKVHNPTSLGVRTMGPYPIERVHVNGNLTLQLCQGVTERINIRRVLPYR
jgi:hypothetical protein